MRNTFPVLSFDQIKNLLSPKQELLTAPRMSCQKVARFSNKVQLSIGSFIRNDQSIEFKSDKYFEAIPNESPSACIGKIGPKNSEYFTAKIGKEFKTIDQDTFLELALSLSLIPMPSRLRYFFSYKKKLNEWLYLSACPVFYELTDGATQKYNRLMKFGVELSMSPGKYFDITEDYLETLDLRKRNAGASRLLERNYLTISNSAPRPNRFNFSPIAFHAGLGNVYFLPDAVVVSIGEENKFYRYKNIRLETFKNRFITHEVPPGVKPVDYTWQYVNKNGDPDRRFNDNFQLPIIEVTELDFYFSDGKQFHTGFTDDRAVASFEAALIDLGART